MTRDEIVQIVRQELDRSALGALVRQLQGGQRRAHGAFRARRTTNFTPAAGTWTKVNFDTVDFDVSSRFDVSNDYYVATAAGIYRFSVRAAFNNAAGFLAARAQHRDSSGTSIETVDFQGIENSATTATAGPGGSLLLSLAAGDRVEVEVYTAAGTVCSGVRFDGEYVGAT